MLSADSLAELMSRLNRADHKSLPIHCRHLIDYIKANVSRYNGIYSGFEDDRNLKWKNWDVPVTRSGQWEFPRSPEECASLAWHLVSTVAETGDYCSSLLFSMYSKKSADDNARGFISGWRVFIQDAINSIANHDRPIASGLGEKHQKFGILDSPTLFSEDVKCASGELGKAAIYLDLDDFKKLNEQLTETLVDKLILPRVHNLLCGCVQNLGYAYAEGGDEFLIFLPNASERIALGVAETLRAVLDAARFPDENGQLRKITASLGVAHVGSFDDASQINENANVAKGYAKKNGKNSVAIWSETGCRISGQDN
jgi:diguanylate cyclase (GGDEF)-like protein